MLKCNQWLEKKCLKYFTDWEQKVQSRTDLSEEDQQKMLLSRETRTGISMTSTMNLSVVRDNYYNFFYIAVKSFIELVKCIFQEKGVKFFLSEHICQDPLEKFFGCQRQRGAVNENPSMKQFCENTQALKVVGSFCRSTVKGNCRGADRKRKRKDFPVLTAKESEPLPKRRRKK